MLLGDTPTLEGRRGGAWRPEAMHNDGAPGQVEGELVEVSPTDLGASKTFRAEFEVAMRPTLSWIAQFKKC